MKFVYILLLIGLATAFFSFLNTLSNTKAKVNILISSVLQFLNRKKPEVILLAVLLVLCILAAGILLYPFYPHPNPPF